MIKHFVTRCFAISTIAFFAVTAHAAQLNLTLGNDIKNNQDNLNIESVIYTASGPGPLDRTSESQSSHGLIFKYIFQWLPIFNKEIADKHPIDNSDGKHSHITLGYVKNGADVSPASCQNMIFKDVMNITLTESGCSIN